MNSNSWKFNLKADPIPWLLKSNPWTHYRTLIDLLDLPADDSEVIEAKKELLADERIKNLISDAADWFPEPFTRHNNPKMSHYKLRMLADFGLTIEDLGITDIVHKASEHREDRLFAVKQELPQKGKGFSTPSSDCDEWHALPCDSPLITYVFLTLGYKTPEVLQTVDLIKEKWNSSQGWFCHFFFVESMFKKLQIGCPMAGLMALEMFSQIPELRESEYAKNAYEPIRFHRDYGKSIYYFGRSKKYRTLKYPFVWYNALYLAEVLTRFEFLKNDILVRELIDWILELQNEEGKFKPTSMFMIHKGWDFANKKEASPWITYLCCNILKKYCNA